MKIDALYEKITENFVEQLEKGVVPWANGWKGGGLPFPYNVESKKPYQGINVWLLAIPNMAKNYPTAQWGTYLQWLHEAHRQMPGSEIRLKKTKKGFAKEELYDKDGNWVRIISKGESSEHIVFYKNVPSGDEGENEGYWLARAYAVFNRAQTVVGRLQYQEEEKPEITRQEVDVYIKEYLKNSGVDLGPGLNPSYWKAGDRIEMPAFDKFDSEEIYLATMFHEMGHSTGVETRLDRDMSQQGFEELVAEMTSAFLCGQFQIEGNLQHVEYLGVWIDKMRENHRIIPQASAQAQKAVNFINEKMGYEIENRN